MPQWLFAANVKIVQTNLRKIELGETQPSIALAVRLVQATGEAVGESLTKFSCQQGLISDSDCTHPPLFSLELGEFDENQRNFGYLFKTARKNAKISQKLIAEQSNYHLRNIFEVESGRRVPGVMTALKLVSLTKCNLSNFFDCYSNFLRVL